MATTASTHAHTHTPWRRAIPLGVVLAALVAIVVLAFSWPSVTSDVHDLPIAIAGDSAQVDAVEQALDDKAEGVFTFTEADDRAAAVDLIERRQVYGAIVLGQPPEVLTASAASPVVSQLLGTIATQLQAQAQAQAAAAAEAAGVTPPTITVTVTDVVPLVDADPRGAGFASAIFPLVLGGLIGGIAISVAIVGAIRRVVALLVYVVAAGLIIPGILQGWFGVLPGDYLLNASVFALALLAIGAPIVGFAALVGRAGVAIGPVLFLLIGNPIASAAAPLEFLPQPWGQVGQWLPPGAGATLLREVAYFPDANPAFPALVLAGWAAAGLVLALAGHFRTAGAATAGAIAEAE